MKKGIIVLIVVCFLVAMTVTSLTALLNRKDEHEKPEDDIVTQIPEVEDESQTGPTVDIDDAEPEPEKTDRQKVEEKYFRRDLTTSYDKIITSESRQAFIDSMAILVEVRETVYELPKGTPGASYHVTFNQDVIYGTRELDYYLADGTRLVLDTADKDFDLDKRETWPGITLTDYHNKYRLVNMTYDFFGKTGEPPCLKVIPDEDYQKVMDLFGEYLSGLTVDRPEAICNISSFDYDFDGEFGTINFVSTLEGLQADGVDIQIFRADGTPVLLKTVEGITSKYQYSFEYDKYLFVRARLYMDTENGRLYSPFCEAVRIYDENPEKNIFED